jgi:hypothetical protein
MLPTRLRLGQRANQARSHDAGPPPSDVCQLLTSRKLNYIMKAGPPFLPMFVNYQPAQVGLHREEEEPRLVERPRLAELQEGHLS